MRMNLLRAGGVLGLAAATALFAVVVPAAAATAGPGEGSAYGADASVSLLPGVLGTKGITVATGQLAPTRTSGPTSASVVDAALKGLVTAKAITSSSVHASTGDVTSKAEIVKAALPVLKALAGRTPTASVISATCHATAAGITGSSDLADLNLGNIGHITAATPNVQVGVPQVLSIVANEQIHNADGSLTVNALHIKLLGGSLTSAVGSGDIVLASATCGPATRTKTSPPPSTPTTTPGKPAAGSPPEVSQVPAGAPETGDGSLATLVVR
jgi:hypothetical protein